jgi:hypothetical protein
MNENPNHALSNPKTVIAFIDRSVLRVDFLTTKCRSFGIKDETFDECQNV